MNLICFPHYTCGGLLSDIFEQTFSKLGTNGGINSITHSLGKIGDSLSVFDDYSSEHFMETIEQLRLAVKKNAWLGTHCWPGLIDVSVFDKVIVVTTATYRSKLYRWIRAYNHYYVKSKEWLELSGLDRIDKERETAKSYLKPFLPVEGNNVNNIEFSEIVENSTEFLKLVQGLNITKHTERWRSINHFLFDNDVWNGMPARALHQAELETLLNKHYVYE